MITVASFIGIAINIWKDTLGTGGTGGVAPPAASYKLIMNDGLGFILLDNGSDFLLLNTSP
jgi:hypothetical protein